MATTTKNKNEITITRTFDALREDVWKVWTDPEEEKKWWGQRASLRHTSRLISRWGASISTACDRQRARIFGAKESTVKSLRLRGSL